VHASLTGDALAQCGYFDPGCLRRIAADHLAGVRDYSTPIWTLLMFESFLRNLQSSAETPPLVKAA
jgi:asparagine synthase (glutamine-hydrolysing)